MLNISATTYKETKYSNFLLTSLSKTDYGIIKRGNFLYDLKNGNNFI